MAVEFVDKVIEDRLCICRKCNGTGEVDGKKCDQCEGTGRVIVSREVKTTIRPFRKD